jgi:anaerobic selenocysteine-containing dehydrogenase
VRSHDEFSTTVYGYDDRYRGIHGGRRVVFVNPADLGSRGLHDGDKVDLISVWQDGERRADGFRAVAYPTTKGCVAAYFPEANVLVPPDSVAETGNTPASKSVPVRLERSVTTRLQPVTRGRGEGVRRAASRAGISPAATGL